MKRLVAFGSLIFLVSCAGPHPVPQTTSTEKPPFPEPPLVRVALFTQVSDVQVGATESFAMGDGDGTIAVGAESDVISVRRDGTRIALYTANGELMDTATGFLRIEPQSDGGLVTVNGVPFVAELMQESFQGRWLWSAPGVNEVGTTWAMSLVNGGQITLFNPSDEDADVEVRAWYTPTYGTASNTVQVRDRLI